MKFSLQIIAVVFLLLNPACSLHSNITIVKFTLPDEYQGLIVVKKDEALNDDPAKSYKLENGTVRVPVPGDGVVLVSDIAPFYGYVTHRAIYESGLQLETITVEFWYKNPSVLRGPSEIEIRKVHPAVANSSQTVLIVPNQPEYGRKLYFVGTLGEFKEFFAMHPELYRVDL